MISLTTMPTIINLFSYIPITLVSRDGYGPPALIRDFELVTLAAVTVVAAIFPIFTRSEGAGQFGIAYIL